MDYFGIAAASMDMSAAKVQQAVQTTMLKKTMDSQEAQAEAMISQMMPPPSSNIIDTYA